ncbi:MAG: bifunctional (p)ppGpp synthetase/guanosine-3',5'-bis(diphosphate) 3'-pyrophosphohydrolase, partial [Chloroflexi bacterium]|nr:bifunctional (p)ppGpp synthetase/guanosine-3',5'-bis(diphosphate) 3'-pyrophosphohydrolase [Chloroflexota bacterium]
MTEPLLGLQAGLDELGRDLVARAYALASRVHAGQTRDEGTPYLDHPVRVAATLVGVGYHDAELLAAALLHDALEDSDLTVDALACLSPRIAEIVATLTKPPLPKLERDAVYFGRLATAATDVLLIKIADRLDNVRG